MVMSLSTATQEALAKKELVVRHLLWLQGRNRSTNEMEYIGMWTGELALDIPVIDPQTQTTEVRSYQPGAGWLKLPSIPQKIELEARSIRIMFSRLPPAAVNIIRAYDPKLRKIEIHRALFDPATRTIVDPAYCLFAGFINRAPINVPTPGGEGEVELEASTNSRYLTRTRGDKFSDAFLKRRNNDRFGKYLDVAGLWRVFWGEEDSKVGEGKKHRRERFDK